MSGQKLSKKQSKEILEKAWKCVRTSDTAGFIKLWILDDKQWPYHNGQKYDVEQIRYNFADFKSYFDTALMKNLNIDEVESDTIEHNDPHHDFATYYIKAWFKYSKNHRRGFGFYMDFVNKEWHIRFSPDYSDETSSKK
jgi:hypothetical protein